MRFFDRTSQELGIKDIFKTSGFITLASYLGVEKMSKTIKNERTRGYLDELATQRKTRKAIRELKTAFVDEINDMFYNVPFAQDY